MVSGRMKECLENSIYVLQNIVERVQDMEYLRAQNVELTSKLRVALSNEEKFRKEIDTLKREVALLKSSVVGDGSKVSAPSPEPRGASSGGSIFWAWCDKGRSFVLSVFSYVSATAAETERAWKFGDLYCCCGHCCCCV